MPTPLYLQWTGAADHVTFDTPGNWYDTVNAAASITAPVTGDYLSFVDGNDVIQTNLNQTAVVPAQLYVGPGFGGDIGLDGTSLTISVSGFLSVQGGRRINITAGSSNIALAQLNGGTVNLNGGTFTRVEAAAGPVAIAGAATVTTLYGLGATVTAAAGAAFTATNISAGSLASSRGLGTCYVGGNALAQTRGAAAPITAAFITGPGRLNHQSSSTITAITAWSGAVVDASGNPYRGFTVTSSYKAPTARLFQSERVTITNTNPTTYYGSQT